MKKRQRRATKAKRRKAPKVTRRRGASTAGLKKQVAVLSRARDEALAQQTAAAEVLQVINASRGSLAPVFDVILEKAHSLCGAPFGGLLTYDGEFFRLAAERNVPPAWAEWVRGPFRPGPKHPLSRFVKGEAPFQIEDLQELARVTDEPMPRAGVELGGIRTLLYVPLRKDGVLFGVITAYRKEVRLFTDKQISLLQNFAAQAVIAIENTRLLNELRQRTDDLSESLEQQTATSEVLQVISSSPGELETVFEAMLANATRICGAKFGTLYLYDGDAFHAAAFHNAPPAFIQERKRAPLYPGPNTSLGLAARTKQVAQIVDITKWKSYLQRDPFAVAGADLGGYRTVVSVPMLKEDKLIGAISVYRQEVRSFTDKQIELVKNFAAQAVIAIENARLLNELRQRTDDLSESLQQQTATSEILEVISNSPTDSQPAFDAIVRSGLKLFPNAVVVISLPDGEMVKAAAIDGTDRADLEALRARYPMPLSREYITSTAILDRREMDFADVRDTPAQLIPGRQNFLASGYRAMTVMPMMRGETAIGAISVVRRRPGALSDKQRELLRTFASQAVIAIENTRLFNELRQRTDDLTESLEQQTATSEVLKVISSSPGELEPVFQAMLENATRICEAGFGTLFRFDGKAFHFAADYGTPPALVEFQKLRGPFLPESGSLLDRVLQTRQVAHAADYAAELIQGPPVTLGGARSTVAVPMLKNNELVGAIVIYRQELRPFSDKQVDLVNNFANQAVIAIENARLLSELRESLQQQTATADVLKVISSSPGDLEPVFQAMLENATRICEANFGVMFRYDGKAFDPAARFGVTPEYAAFLQQRGSFRPRAGTGLDRLLQTKDIVRIADDATGPTSIGGPARLGGARSRIVVPMLKDDELIGAITIYRQEVRPFTDKQIELVTEFRRPGRHRHREHAAAQRAARIPAATNRHRRRAQGHQSFDFRPSDCS